MDDRTVPTLRQIWAEYKKVRKLKPSTLEQYESSLNWCCKDWLDLPIDQITKAMIEDRHYSSSRRNGTKGTGAGLADRSMRTLRALFSFALYKYDDLGLKNNPVKILSHLRMWNNLRRRKTKLDSRDMPKWFATVLSWKNPVIRDYLLFLLFTGTRRSEAARLKWEDVDFYGKTITFRNTKNGDDHVLPFSDFIEDVLVLRRLKCDSAAEFVFSDGGDKVVSLFSKSSVYVGHRAGVPFRLHDLRRTFASAAEELNIPFNVIKRLLNHRCSDVTSGYIVQSVNRLREPMQRITDELLSWTEAKAHLPPELTVRRMPTSPPVLRGHLETEIIEIANKLPAKFTARQVFEIINEKRQLTYSTVNTTMSRLARTGWLTAERGQNCAYLYSVRNVTGNEASFSSHSS
jgi:integrase